MKISAILLMLLGVFLILVWGFVFLLGFALSFDAPGSDTDLKAWGFRLIVFMPIVIFVVILILAMRAFYLGNYGRSFRFGLVFGVSAMILVALSLYRSYSTMDDYHSYLEQEAEYERLYPKQKFLRPVASGTDTIFVFPNGIVSYRVIGPDFPLSGPLGDLNPQRDSIFYNRSPHNDLQIDELDLFIDEQGRKLTDVFVIH